MSPAINVSAYKGSCRLCIFFAVYKEMLIPRRVSFVAKKMLFMP